MKTIKFLLIAVLFIGAYSASAQSTSFFHDGTNLYYTGGKVGIGTSTPATIFNVNSTAAPNILVKNTGGTGGANFTMWDQGSNSQFIFKSFSAGTGGFKIRDNSNAIDVITIENNSIANAIYVKAGGNIGIGTATPTTKFSVAGGISSTSLAVNGKITTKEVEVTLSGWPDYVFEKEYKLSPLSEVEKFISENKHLPGVTSAQEIEKNGLSLGEMNKVLMQKVEELTLYVIDLQKQIDELKE